MDIVTLIEFAFVAFAAFAGYEFRKHHETTGDIDARIERMSHIVLRDALPRRYRRK